MAKLIQAYKAYGPQVELGHTIQLDRVAEWMAMRTGLNKSEIMMTLQEINEAILFFNSQGIPVKLPGVGTFTPSIDGEGVFKVNLRADPALKKGMNSPDRYNGPVTNRENIGLGKADYKALWDTAHPDDPLEI